MLVSVQIARRQSEIRQNLSELAGKENPSEDETRKMGELDREYRSNETRYRAALIAEDTERREAGAELENRSAQEWAEVVSGFEMRQVVGALHEGRSLNGQTAEVVEELRSQGGYRGIPVPLLALEQRAGETVAGGTPNPITTRPIIDRLFPASVAARMGAQMIQIASGAQEWPVVTSAVTAGWANGETGNVADPTAYVTSDKTLKPDYTMGVQMRLTRKTLMQSGEALEQAVRRDMNGAMGQELDRAIFLGSGENGQPLGVISGAATYGITETAVDAAASWAAYRAQVTAFMTGNLASSPDAVRALMRPEVWSKLDDSLISATAVSEWDRMTRNIPASNIAMSANALEDPVEGATKSLLTTAAGGVAPIFVGLWGAVDLIRDPYTDAQSGGLRITALTTADIAVARPSQLRVMSGVNI